MKHVAFDIEASDQLKKMNKDCKLTAGLEAELTIAVDLYLNSIKILVVPF